MKHFFGADGPLYKFFSRFWDILVLNFLWLFLSGVGEFIVAYLVRYFYFPNFFIWPGLVIPAVFFGPATVAGFDVSLRMVEDRESYTVNQFLKAFKGNLKHGIPMGLLFLVFLYAVYLDFQFVGLSENGVIMWMVISGIAVFCGMMVFLFAFPLSARYENGFIATLKNSFFISVRYFGRVIVLAIIIAAEIALFIWNEFMMLFGLIIGPLMIIFTISAFAMKIFREIEKDPGAVQGPSDLIPGEEASEEQNGGSKEDDEEHSDETDGVHHEEATEQENTESER